MATKAQWQPGHKSTDAVAVVEATDSQLGVFTIRLEDPSASDDEIASGFDTFAREFADKKATQDKESGSQPLDLQRAVPVQDQLESLKLSTSDTDAVKRVVSFQRFVDSTPHGSPFSKSMELLTPKAQEESKPDEVHSTPVPLTGGAAESEQALAGGAFGAAPGSTESKVDRAERDKED